MPAILAFTITVWCPIMFLPLRGDDGFLAVGCVRLGNPGDRLIDKLREPWLDAERPNHDAGFAPSEVSTHVNGWGCFTVAGIAHEGDAPILKALIEQCLDWKWDDGSGPVRIQHNALDLEGEE